jgi:predicted SnoaL-like aldol condensation-catalyzing enzyme
LYGYENVGFAYAMGDSRGDDGGCREVAINDKEPADAVAKYVGAEYIQHNPDTPDGAGAFIQSMKDLFARFPKIRVEIKRVIAEGDLVVVHNLVKTTPEDRGMAGDINRSITCSAIARGR